MQIEPDVLRRHLEAAAIEQVAKRLRGEGYEVEEAAKLGSATADLVATRGSNKAVYEFKVVGLEERGWSEQASRLREMAKRDGARFHLILVPWPGGVRIEIADIERTLREALQTSLLPRLQAYPSGIELTDIREVSIIKMKFENSEMALAGNAVATAVLAQDEAETEMDIIPFYFEVKLTGTGELKSIQRIEVDPTY